MEGGRREYNKRMSLEQISALLQYLGEHRCLARGELRHKAAGLWDELAAKLNAVPDGARKDAKSWSKCWADLKSRVKKKHQSLVRGGGGVGGGGGAEAGDEEGGEGLTELESRILEVMSREEDEAAVRAFLAHRHAHTDTHVQEERLGGSREEGWLHEELLEAEGDPLQAAVAVKAETSPPAHATRAARRTRPASPQHPHSPQHSHSPKRARSADEEVHAISPCTETARLLARAEERRAQAAASNAEAAASSARALHVIADSIVRFAAAVELVAASLERLVAARAPPPARPA